MTKIIPLFRKANMAKDKRRTLLLLAISAAALAALILPAVSPSSEAPGQTHYITASSDEGTAISPSGLVSAQYGSDKTFYFSANEGYYISAVLVDGNTLSFDQIYAGSFTFTDVRIDHTIEVKSTTGYRNDITLIIEIKEGKGRADYSINGGPLSTYTAVVHYIPEHAYEMIIAVPDIGYEFDKWLTPDVCTTSEISFYDVNSPLYLELYFKVVDKGYGPLLWIIIAALILAVIGTIAWYILRKKQRGQD